MASVSSRTQRDENSFQSPPSTNCLRICSLERSRCLFHGSSFSLYSFHDITSESRLMRSFVWCSWKQSGRCFGSRNLLHKLAVCERQESFMICLIERPVHRMYRTFMSCLQLLSRLIKITKTKAFTPTPSSMELKPQRKRYQAGKNLELLVEPKLYKA